MRRGSGLQLFEQFLSAAECEEILASVEEYRGRHDLPLISRPDRKRPLLYRVINGDEIGKRLPLVQKLYENMLGLLRQKSAEELVPLSDPIVGVNVNITPPGGAYRWHYDRNAVTAVLYLNQVEGGETEAYPDYRLLLTGSRSSVLQSHVDRVLRLGILLRLFGHKRIITPKPGLLVLMRGDRCLHSVRPVLGDRERICIVMSFDSPNAVFPQEVALNSYLYTSQVPAAKRDPNYSR